MKERWLEIEGYEGLYEISNLGKVKSLTKGLGSRKKAWEDSRILGGWIKPKDNYLQVRLYKNKKGKTFCVHILVLLAFVGPKPTPKHCGLHKDDDKSNNTLRNLYWGTKKDNSDDRRRNKGFGGALRGDDHPRAILTTRKARRIRFLYGAKKYTQKALAEKFGVARSTINATIKGKLWKYA